MKPFNLEEAINGKAFYLRNGYRGIIKYCVADRLTKDNVTLRFAYVGYILDKNGFLYLSNATWDKDGFSSGLSQYDAVEMREEPKKQINIEDLPKPFKPKLGEYYYRITSRTIFNTLNIREKQYSDPEYDDKAVNQGNCFRTREDAQKWLDFMKSMKE